MVTIELDWKHNRDDWKTYIRRVGLQQQQIASFIGVSEQVMTKLVQVMTDGQGLLAKDVDRKRWTKAVDYVEFQASKVKEETK